MALTCFIRYQIDPFQRELEPREGAAPRYFELLDREQAPKDSLAALI